MRNSPFSVNLEQESQIDSDPSLHFVEKSLCNRCQQYLDKGLSLREHLKTCSPMYITTISKKEKDLNLTKDNSENPIPYPPSIKKLSKAKVVKRKSIKEQENALKKKKLDEEDKVVIKDDFDSVINTRRSSTRQSSRISSSLNRSKSIKSSNSRPAALYKRKLSEAHEVKRDNLIEDNNRKKPKKNYLEIPSETTFKANVIKEEDKRKPICARTRSSKTKSLVEDVIDKIVEIVPEEKDNVENEEIILLTKSKRTKTEPKFGKMIKEKIIPKKIIIPPKSTTKKYPNLPSPIHTITRSKGDKSESPTQDSPIEKLFKVGKQIRQEDLVVLDTILGEGQVGTVNLAKYKGLLVACKSKRANTRLEPFYYQIQRELKYAADLSVCRYINKYIGWVYCPRYKVEQGITDARSPKLYVIQKYIANGDARSYLDGRESTFRPCEAVQAAICLFSALTDAHSLGIGIVDLKLENFLIDSSGAGWLTDFGSCIEFYDREQVDLDDEEVAWTTNVAAPEMIDSNMFSKASDVFMATLIVAELLTVELSDKQFYTQVLKRRRSNGSVQFTTTLLHRRYNDFFPLLEQGLNNNPKDRPSAKDMLDSFILLRTKIVQP